MNDDELETSFSDFPETLDEDKPTNEELLIN